MKKKIVILLLILSPQLFFSCYQYEEFTYKLSLRDLYKRMDKLIDKSHESVDTVYVYTFGGTGYIYTIWYYKDDFLHSFRVKPYKSKVLKPVEAKNIIFDSYSYNECLTYSFYKEKSFKCFEPLLGGGRIYVYIKGEDRSHSTSIDTDCLFQTKYPKNSFPYKLQYDLSKIKSSFSNFDFEKMYPSLEDTLIDNTE